MPVSISWVSALGGSIGRHGLAAQLAHHGADVDDLALALGDHVGQNGLGAVEGTAHMHVDDPHEILSLIHIYADGGGHRLGQQGGVLLFGQVQRQGKSKGTAQALSLIHI